MGTPFNRYPGFVEDERYWLGQLSGDISGSILPFDMAGSREQAEFDSYHFLLGAELVFRLVRVCQHSALHEMMLLTAGLSLLLKKYTGLDETYVRLSDFRDTEEATEAGPLLFSNADDDKVSVREMLGHVQLAVSEMNRHADYPLQELIERQHFDKGDLRYVPLIAMKGIQQDIVPENGKQHWTLSFSVTEENISCRMGFDTGCYTMAGMAKFADHFVRVIEQMVFFPDRRLGDVEIISDRDWELILGQFNSTGMEYPKDGTIGGLFAEQAILRGGEEAIREGEAVMTYKELEARSNQVARVLQQEGITPEGRVAVIADRTMSSVIGMLGILKAGGCYVPLDGDQPAERLQYMLEDCGVSVALLGPGEPPRLPAGLRTFRVEEMGREQQTGSVSCPAMAGSLSYVMYTSGSTGRPKGVMVTHRNVIRLVRNTNFITLDDHTRILQTGAPSFDATTFEIWGSLLNGGMLLLAGREELLDTGRLGALLREHAINTLWLTSSLFNQHAQRDAGIFGGLRYLLAGGEALSPYFINKVRDSHPDIMVINGYGPTENTTFSVCCRIDRRYEGNIPIGRPIGNSTAYIFDKRGLLQPIGVRGELWVGGDGVARGYVSSEELTRERFVENPFVAGERLYRTGDLARWREDGQIEYLGRMDKQIKVRGFRIEPAEIESRLNGFEGVRESVVVAADGEDGEMYMAAYYVSGKAIGSSVLREYLRQDLPEYMLPQYYIHVDQIPLTRNGKLDLERLPPAEQQPEEAYIAPQGDLEEKLVELWSEVLKRERGQISVERSFFEMGGHSLRGAILINRLNKELEVELNLRDLFRYPDVRSLGMRIGELTRKAYLRIGKAGQKESYVLSPAQRRLYFLYEFDKTSLAYNMPQVYRLQGNLDKQAIEAAFAKLIRRHESLRTVFERRGDVPVQRILEDADLSLSYCCCREDEVEGRIGELIAPFDLMRGPLLRVSLIEVSETLHVLVIDMHHIIIDGFSQGILFKDLMAFYSGEQLPPLDLQYKDFAEWQQGHLQQQHIRSQKAFWMDLFKDIPQPVELPADFNRQARRSSAGSLAGFELDEKMTAGLRLIAEKEKATLFMVLLSAYVLLISKLSNQHDIVIGTAIAGRQHADLEQIIGMFVNLLPLRNQVRAGLSYSQFLSAVKSDTLECLENQQCQYEDLIESLAVTRAEGRNPLFDVAFTYQSYEGSEWSVPGLQIETRRYDHRVSKFDLTLLVQETEERMLLSFEYSTELFRERTIERIIACFREILTAIIDNREVLAVDIGIISEAERQLILGTFNATRRSYPRESTIGGLFAEQAILRSGEVAVYEGDRTMTYMEMDSRSNQVARLLQRWGLEAEGRVAVIAGRTTAAVIGMLGILKAGGCYVPLDGDQPEERLRYMLENSGAAIVLWEGAAPPALVGGLRGIAIGQAGREEDSGPVSCPAHADSLSYIMYTSGSTGRPKGVMVTHRNVLRLVRNTDYTTLSSSTRILQTGAPSFDATTFEIWGSLLNGGMLVLAEREVLLDTRRLGELLRRHSVNTLFLTTALFNQHAQRDAGIFDGLHYLMVGGEILSPYFINKVRDLHPGLLLSNIYGPTENTTFSTCYRIDRRYEVSIPIGRPIANSTAYIFDEQGLLQPIGVRGELWVGGDGVARGYVSSEELTRERFVGNPVVAGERLYRTGDLARWREDGQIEYLGRLDKQVKIRGFRVEPGEIESRLNGYMEVQESVVLVAEGQDEEKYLVAYYVSAGPIPASALRDYLRRALPEYMVPGYFVRLEAIPLTFNGKLDRKQLPLPTGQEPEEAYTAPQDELEVRLVALWAEVLKLEAGRISVDRSFFEIGGHSLRAAILVNKLNKELEVGLGLRDLFRYPEIRSLGRRIRELDRKVYCRIEKAAKKEWYGLSSAQRRLYFLYEFDRESLAYNMVQVFRLRGRISKSSLDRAFEQLIRRHESLRTVFVLREEGPVQQILEETGFSIAYSECREEDIDITIRRFLRVFCLDEGPLLRVTLAGLSEYEHILMIDMHHIIMDGISQEVLVRDLIALYNGEELPPLQLQYKDYSEWQQTVGQQTQLQSQRDFWLGLFRDIPPTAELPVDFPRPAKKSSAGDNVALTLSEADTTALRSIAEGEGATLFMVLLSVWTILISKLCNQDDIVIGTAAAGRQHADLEQMIGLFINTLPLRNHVDRKKSFREFLSQVRAGTIAAIDNSSYEYEDLVAELRIQRDKSRNPLFDLLFVYLEATDHRSGMEGISIEPVVIGKQASKFDLTLDAMDTGERIILHFEYATALFRKETIGTFAAYFKRIIAAIIEDSDILIGDIGILTAEETGRLLDGPAGAHARTLLPGREEKPVILLFEEQTAARPDHIALECGRTTLTYGALNDMAEKVAAYLIGIGVASGDLVGVILQRDERLVACLLGILKIGAAYVPIDAGYPLQRIEEIVTNAGLRFVIAGARSVSIPDGRGPEVIELPARWQDIENASRRAEKTEIDMDSLAYVIYTSGSTGKPKGVAIQHGSLANYIIWAAEQYVKGETATFPLYTSISFDLTVTSVFVPLITGNRIIIYEEGGAGMAIEKVIAENRCDVMKLTPSHLRVIRDLDLPPGAGGSNIRRFIVGGEDLDTRLAKDIHDKFGGKVEIYNEYGPTEATVGCMIYQFRPEDDLASVPIGVPIRNMQIYLLDGGLRPVISGAQGEIYILGEGVARGYYMNPDLTAASFSEDPYRSGRRMYRTGDTGIRLKDGNILFKGRVDQQVKIRGFRIEPGEIEQVLLRSGMVSDALVIPRVVQGDMCLVCYYIGQADPGAAFIRQYLGSRLPEYMIPASFVKLDAFPLSSNGKIDKKSLPDPELSSGRDTAPKDNLQKELAWIWSQVLKLEEGKIGVTANFFDIGGNSLKLVKLASLINKQFKTELSVSDMFKYPTILSTAQFLAENAGASAGEGDGEMMESVDRLHETVGLLNEIK